MGEDAFFTGLLLHLLKHMKKNSVAVGVAVDARMAPYTIKEDKKRLKSTEIKL